MSAWQRSQASLRTEVWRESAVKEDLSKWSWLDHAEEWLTWSSIIKYSTGCSSPNTFSSPCIWNALNRWCWSYSYVTSWSWWCFFSRHHYVNTLHQQGSATKEDRIHATLSWILLVLVKHYIVSSCPKTAVLGIELLNKLFHHLYCTPELQWNHLMWDLWK